MLSNIIHRAPFKGQSASPPLLSPPITEKPSRILCYIFDQTLSHLFIFCHFDKKKLCNTRCKVSDTSRSKSLRKTFLCCDTYEEFIRSTTTVLTPAYSPVYVPHLNSHIWLLTSKVLQDYTRLWCMGSCVYDMPKRDL